MSLMAATLWLKDRRPWPEIFLIAVQTYLQETSMEGLLDTLQWHPGDSQTLKY